MKFIQRTLLLGAAVCASPFVVYGANEAKIADHIRNLSTLSATERPKQTAELAGEVRALPAGKEKVNLADQLARDVTQGDQGHDTVQAVADTLRQALAETPIPAKKGEPPAPYMDLAKLVRYEHATANLNDPLFAKANDKLAADEADVQKADFTLQDLHGKKYTLSALRGKVVLVNFWSTDCQPCQADMQVLDSLAQYFAPQGLVVLSVSEDDAFKVATMMKIEAFHGVMLFDSNKKAAKTFHVDGVPRTFLFDQNGKLAGEAIDQGSQRQFLAMLATTGLKP